MKMYSPVKILYNKEKSPHHAESILKSSLSHSLVLNPLNPLNRSKSDIVTATSEKHKRVSALQVKNIDGKVFKNDEAK